VRGITGRDEVVGRAGAVDQLGDVHVVRREVAEVGGLEALDDDGVSPVGVAVGRQHGEEPLLEGEADRVEVARVLRLGVDADRVAVARAGAAGEVDDLVEGRHLVEAVEGGVPRRVAGIRSVARRVRSSQG
jgi:hypothetical protein